MHLPQTKFVVRLILAFWAGLFLANCAKLGWSATTPASPTTASLSACPFCSAIALTFTEQLNNSDIAVVAKLVKVPPPMLNPADDFPKAEFEIVNILKGKKFVGQGMKFKTQLVGSYAQGQNFLVMGVDPPKVAWTTPMKASARVFEYLDKIQSLPETGPERLVFFQDYFEDKESVLAFDAYDEFARAPYEDLLAMKPKMDHDKLIGWITSKKTSVNRRRLYFTMLGVCGKQEDIKLLEELITSDSRKKRAGLDALIACYLNLKGEDGVDLVEKTFIIDKDADYVDTLAAVSALRFHGTEVDFVPKKRIVKAIRHLLDRPKMADMVIPDLARWEDWSVMERLVKMFKEADPESNWLRVPVITYLRACPKPEAKTYIAELQKIDPEAVQRADFFLGFDDDEDDWDDDTDDEDKTDDADKANKPSAAKPSGDTIQSNEPSGKLSNELTHVVQRIPLEDDTQEGTFATEKNALEPSDTLIDSGTQTVGTSVPQLTTNLASPPNPDVAVFVTSGTDSITAKAPAVAQSIPVASPVVIAQTPDLTWSIVFIPMASSVLIFLLLWSVVSGWFERLIF
ncbi:MAG: hypothetical protein P8J27_01955 [Mariniblastus sp.]|nr:hypothetical protein [Mariniblastus sp.]